MKVQEYVSEDGKSPYSEWFKTLKQDAAAKVAAAKYRLETGNTSSIKWIGVIGEYRIDWGPGYRIYLAKDGQTLIVLYGGGTKKTQSTDIKKAKKLHKEYKQRRKAAKQAAKRTAIKKKQDASKKRRKR